MSPRFALFENGFLTLNRIGVIASLTAMSCIVFANVVLRYFTNNSIVWAEEAARYLMIYMTFLSAGLALRAGLLVAVSQIHQRYSPQVGRIIRVVLLLAMSIFCLWMIYAGLEYMTRMGRQVTPSLRLSFSYIYLAMPLGFGLLFIHILLVARHFVTAGRFDQASSDDYQASATGG